VDAADFLLSNGANPNAANQHGFTPLHFAVYFASDMDIVKLLVNHKDTNVNYLDNKGNDALHYAMINGHGCGRAIAKLLKRKGVVEEIIGQDDLLDECKGGDGNNDSMVKEVPNEAIVHPDVELHRILIEIGIDACKTTPLLKVGGGINNLHHVLSSCLKVWESININAIEILDVILASAGEFDINIRDEEGMTLLHYAITENTVEMVRYLLKKGADPTIRNNEGNNSFHLAVLFLTDTDVLDLMLGNENKIEIDERNKKGKTALHMAVMDSNTAAAKFLLSNGANPNVADEHGVTPLHVAAKYAKGMDIVELLLNRHGVDVNCFDNLGYNALAYAKYNDHGLSEAIGNLLRAKMDASAEGSNYKPKNIAAWVDSDMETIRFLIENGQDVSAMTWGENGANALHLAAANEKTTDLIDIILVSRQCNINSVDSDGRTPLHYAIKRPDPVTINNARRLIKMGADPGIADKNGVTPLHMAARNAETMDLIEILLNTGTLDVNCVDKQGRTPLDCARGNKHGLGEKIINRLRE
jgi:ankyrin repeat protein